MNLPNAEEILKEHCNTEFSKKTGDELVYSSVPAVVIAMHEYARRVLDVAAEEAKVDDFFDQRDCSTRAFVDKSSILRLKELLK